MAGGGLPVIQTVRDRSPVAALRRHVACVWVQEVAVDSAPFTHRRAPTGCAEIVCSVGSAPRLLGPRSGVLVEPLGPGATVVGVRLRPGAVLSVFGAPAGALVDLEIGIGELWGRQSAEALQDAIAGAPTPDRAAAMLEQAVVGRLPEASGLDPLASEAFDRLVSGEAASLGALAASLFISERQLRRRYETAIGLGPKAVHRIVRFQRFLALAWTLERPSDHLALLAAQAGYADQSHLAREAARLEGRTPRTILLEAQQRCGCGHDHAASYRPLLAKLEIPPGGVVGFRRSIPPVRI